MDICRVIEELKNTCTLTQETLKTDLDKISTEFVSLFGSYVKDAEIDCFAYGKGKVIDYKGDTFENLIIIVQFSNTVKQFSLKHIAAKITNQTTFVDTAIYESYNKALAFYTDVYNEYKTLEEHNKQLLAEAEKKAEIEKKNEEKYRKLKAKAIADFNKLIQQPSSIPNTGDKLYYALGWLAKHVGTITATLPDYLESAFVKNFGDDAEYTLIDARKKTSGGHAMKRSWSFNASLKKAENIPAFLSTYLNSTGKSITNTAFIWDIVEDYGFNFGKKQNIEQIRDNVPAQYLDVFEAGFAA